MSEENKIKLLPDGCKEPIEVLKRISETSLLIKEMLKDLPSEEETIEIPLPNVTLPILKKVFEWTEWHLNNPPEVDENGKPKAVGLLITKDAVIFTDFDEIYCKHLWEDWKDHTAIFHIIAAANYLNVQGLLYLCCKYVAMQIGEKTPGDIAKTFHQKKWFTKEEEEESRRSFPFLGDDSIGEPPEWWSVWEKEPLPLDTFCHDAPLLPVSEIETKI